MITMMPYCTIAAYVSYMMLTCMVCTRLTRVCDPSHLIFEQFQTRILLCVSLPVYCHRWVFSHIFVATRYKVKSPHPEYVIYLRSYELC